MKKEIEELKKVQEELREKSVEDIMELKKEQDRLVVEKAQHWDHSVQFQEAFLEELLGLIPGYHTRA